MSTRQKNPAPVVPKIANGHDAGDDGIVLAEVDGATGTAEPDVAIVDGAAAEVGADAGIEALKAQLAEQERLRLEAERQRDELMAQRQNDQREVVDNRMLVLDATIKRQEGEKSDLMRQKIEAKEAGDYKMEAELDDKLQQLNIDLKQTKLGKARLESDLEEARDPQRQTQQPRVDDSESLVEQMIRVGRLDARSASWLRSHPEFAEAGPNNDRLQRAHAFAMSHDGVTAASSEYFRLLEERLGLRQVADDGGQTGAEEPPARQTAPPAAPVSRGAGVGGGRGVLVDHGEGRTITDLGSGKVRISPKMAEYAVSIGMTPQAYATEALKLQREGKLN